MTESATRYDIPWRRAPDDQGRVVCVCGHVIFDGEAIRSRCVKPAEGLALCRCKRWVEVPIRPK